jgi:tRNA (guanine-N7-)-methyltransferase
MDIELHLGQLQDAVNWSALFGNTHPIEIELGCGKGRFIIQSARQNPAVNYLGIEKSAKFFRILKQRAVDAELANIRLLRWEAAYFLGKYVPPGSIQACHIYFPDPWPKKRHRKRRLINQDFMACLAACLQAGGSILLATDFADYFEQMLASARACPELQEVYTKVLDPAAADPEQAATNYERKYLLQGRAIYKAAYSKKA